MAKYNMVPFLLRFTAVLLVVGYPVTSRVIAQQTSWDSVFKSFLPESEEPPVSQPGGAQARQPQPGNQDNEPPVYQPGGTRGGFACFVTPLPPKPNNAPPTEIWNNRPLFAWKGDVRQLEVYSEAEGELIWKQLVKSGTNHISYTGEPLKSGATYILNLYETSDPEYAHLTKIELDFKVIDAKEYEQITQDLNQLQAEHQQKQSTPEEIALARAQYFADRQLWSDAIMESVLVENPSSSLKELLETKIIKYLCPPPPPPPNPKK